MPIPPSASHPEDRDPGEADPSAPEQVVFDDPAVVAALLEAVLGDRQRGVERTCADYEGMFPGHEDLVRRQWQALHVPATGARTTPAADLAHYRIEGEIGRGGQGVVYRAVDARLGRPVALKVLAGMPSPAVLARFRREAELTARLDHPGICRILDSGEDAGRTYIAMGLIAGRSLADEIAQRGRAPEGRAEFDRLARLFESAGRALEAAHGAGVLHRDLKPGNLMVAPDDAVEQGERLVILDFGLARDGETGGQLTETGDVFGTPAYMPAEQLAGEGARLDARADVYALGAALFEALTGRPPFVASGREALYRAILTQGAPSPQTINRAVPADLARVALTALAREKGDRYPSARAFADDLARFARREPIRARPTPPWLRLGRWAQRNPGVALLAGLLVVVLTSAVVVLYQNNRELQAALDDAAAGRQTKRERSVEEHVRRGFQTLFSADPRGAERSFDAALELAPAQPLALAGRVWAMLERPEEALAWLDERDIRAPELPWLRGMALERLGRGQDAAAAFAAAGERRSAVRVYLDALSRVSGFTNADPDRAREAIPLFEEAVLRSEGPQFPFVHSLLMAAARAGERATMDRAASLLEHHWPGAQGTLDAIAQFYFVADPRRARAALEQLVADHDSAPACFGLAQMARAAGDEAEAKRWLERCGELDPSFLERVQPSGR